MKWTWRLILLVCKKVFDIVTGIVLRKDPDVKEYLGEDDEKTK